MKFEELLKKHNYTRGEEFYSELRELTRKNQIGEERKSERELSDLANTQGE